MTTEEKFRKLLAMDSRYTREAYGFVFDALRTAQEREEFANGTSGSDSAKVRHVTGAQICETARELALSRYGMLARRVLKQWGILGTGDLGELIYRLIEVGLVHRTEEDRREDFDNVFDFETEWFREFCFRSARGDRK
ncbi:MAG: hypothetical protein Q4C47_08530 [Planctomycetia bacterium]|nr:hypothetical protein [Planctomycetia bacterium]